ncbi:MAG TPA: hypothetical protein VLC12_00660 [Terriglobales bacterium]|nr:hypothetical protein [Terriglobales bacterium]
MRHFRWAILIAELVLLALALAVPPVDLPQTAFDEANTPINQATVMVVLGCRSALGTLHSAAFGSFTPVRERKVHSFLRLFSDREHRPPTRSVLSLLCTLLC